MSEKTAPNDWPLNVSPLKTRSKHFFPIRRSCSVHYKLHSSRSFTQIVEREGERERNGDKREDHYGVFANGMEKFNGEFPRKNWY